MPVISVERGKMQRKCHNCDDKIPKTDLHLRITKVNHWLANICGSCIKAINKEVNP